MIATRERRPVRLLVSVADAREARAALAAGADVIDAKDPRHGALGPVAPEVLAAICDAVAGSRPVSAALGDAPAAATGAAVGRAAELAAARGVAFVKLGLAGVASAARARTLGAAAVRAAGDCTAVVLVAYADWRRADSLAPARVCAAAAAVGARGVLLDTAVKDAPLFALWAVSEVGAWVHAAHAAGLFAALAGGLGERDIALAAALGADVVGVRGAACVGGRTGPVSRARVAALAARTRAAARGRPLALV
jgi:uncharacterized protein (UPF0264 family)